MVRPREVCVFAAGPGGDCRWSGPSRFVSGGESSMPNYPIASRLWPQSPALLPCLPPVVTFAERVLPGMMRIIVIGFAMWAGMHLSILDMPCATRELTASPDI